MSSCNPFDVAVQLFTRYAEVSKVVYLEDLRTAVNGQALAAKSGPYGFENNLLQLQ